MYIVYVVYMSTGVCMYVCMYVCVKATNIQPPALVLYAIACLRWTLGSGVALPKEPHLQWRKRVSCCSHRSASWIGELGNSNIDHLVDLLLQSFEIGSGATAPAPFCQILGRIKATNIR